MEETYQDFLLHKTPRVLTNGIAISQEHIHSSLFPFQKDIVQWAVQRGRAAIWADTGLGKSRMALEWARLLGKRTLILCPLAVAHQFVEEGEKIDMALRYIRTMDDVRNAPEQ